MNETVLEISGPPLFTILQNLDGSDLSNAELVSKTWRETVIRLLQERVKNYNFHITSNLDLKAWVYLSKHMPTGLLKCFSGKSLKEGIFFATRERAAIPYVMYKGQRRRSAKISVEKWNLRHGSKRALFG